jgi:hypothetical protein
MKLRDVKFGPKLFYLYNTVVWCIVTVRSIEVQLKYEEASLTVKAW